MPSARRRGFTLVEMIAVIAILAIMVGVAVTRIDFMIPRYRLRAAAREVAGHVKRARSQAASTGKDVYVKYDLGKGTYWLLVAFPKTEEGQEPVLPPKEFAYEEFKKEELPEGVDFVNVIADQTYATGVVTLRVSPFGSLHHHIVNLRNKEGREIALKVNGFTGAVTFSDKHLQADELLEDR